MYLDSRFSDKFNSKEGKEFRQVIKGTNLITPYFIGYERILDGVVEISKGEKLFDTEMYGVTVMKNNKHDFNLSKCLHSMEEVEEYIKELNNENFFT